GLCHAALAPAAYASRIVLPPSLQGSLPAGWLSLYREGVEPSGSLQKVQIIHPPFLDLAWRKGSFILNLPLPSHHSITSSARASRVGGISSPSAFAVLRLMTRNATGFALFEFSMGTKWLEMLRELVPSVKKIGFMSAVRSCCRPTWNV